MNYKNPYILKGNVGNNALSYEERMGFLGIEPTLTIPSLKEGTLDDVVIGDDIVFEEVDDGVLRSCKGLKNFVRLTCPVIARDEAIQAPKSPSSGSPHSASLHSRGQDQQITIFDNHNHALYFWLEPMRSGIISPGAELIHIDEHSDLWDNQYPLDRERAISDEDYAWQYTNLSCNVGNYIRPALDVGIVGNIIRIENNFQVDDFMDYNPGENSILNIDLDFFAPEMDHIPEERKIRIIRNLIPKVKCVTIATSPYFINQCRALQKLRSILIE